MEAPARLSTLLALLKRNGVASYRNADVNIEFGAVATAHLATAKASRGASKDNDSVRVVDAVDLVLDAADSDFAPDADKP